MIVIAKYHRLPEWLRWILLIPLTLLFTGGVCGAVAWILGQHYHYILRQVVAISSFMLFAYLFAPQWQKWFALGVVIGRIVVIAVVMVIGHACGGIITREV